MLRLARERDELRVVADQIGAPTWVRPLAEHALKAVRVANGPKRNRNRTGLLSPHGQWANVPAPGFAEAILAAVADPARRAKRINAITTAEFPTPQPAGILGVVNAKLASAIGAEMDGGPRL